jgi:beta-lactam-binding protein with PASTA domain
MGATLGMTEDQEATVVPHVVGHHIDLALRRIEDLGLVARVVTTEVHDKSDRHVVSTTPAGGSVARRPIVEVVVGIAPTVKDYVGREVDEAVHAAELAGHVVEVLPPRSTAVGTAHLEHAVVLDQEPPAGECSRVLLLHIGPAGDAPTPPG